MNNNGNEHISMSEQHEALQMEKETLLSDEKSVTRKGDVVLRPSGPWSPSIHGLLRHLKHAGFSAAPDIAGSGYDSDGRETLGYVEGEFVHPGPWSDEALAEVGRMVSRLHDAAASFEPADDAVWKPWFLREFGASARVISHGDIAPWNMVTSGGMPVALIDWEYAGPVDPMVELARVCWLFPQLHDDDVGRMHDLPSASVRARQVRIIADAYGVTDAQRHSLLYLIIEVAVRETAQEAIDAGITPDSTGPQWGLAWRSRAAAWMLKNRSVLEQALI